MTNNLSCTSPEGNTDPEPKWLVIHYPVDRPKRQRWLRQLADDLVAHGWVIWREGADAHVKHRSLMPN